MVYFTVSEVLPLAFSSMSEENSKLSTGFENSLAPTAVRSDVGSHLTPAQTFFPLSARKQ